MPSKHTVKRVAADWSTTRRRTLADLRKTLASHHYQLLVLANRADIHPREKQRRETEIRRAAQAAVDNARATLRDTHARLRGELRESVPATTEQLQRRVMLSQLAASSLDGLSPRAAVAVVEAAAARSREEGQAFAQAALARFADSGSSDDVAALTRISRRTLPDGDQGALAFEQAVPSWDPRPELGFDHHAAALLESLGAAPSGWQPGDEIEPALQAFDTSLRRLHLYSDQATTLEGKRFLRQHAEITGAPPPVFPDETRPQATTGQTAEPSSDEAA